MSFVVLSKQPKPKTMPKKTAISYACKLLALRDYTENALRSKLALKGYPEVEITEAINHLKSQGLLDDVKTAKGLIRYATEVKALGKRAAKSYLHSKGVSESIASSLINDIDEQSLAMQFAQKRLRQMPIDASEVAKKRRLYNALAYRGFSQERIYEVLNVLFKP